MSQGMFSAEARTAIDRARRTSAVPVSAFTFRAPESQGKPSGQSELRKGGGPARLAKVARLKVEQGGLMKMMLNSCRRTLLSNRNQKESESTSWASSR